MSNEEIRSLFIRELTMPSDQLKKAHPTIGHYQPEFVSYGENGALTLSFPVRSEQRNGFHLLQGGVLSSFIDDVFGIFVYITSGHHPLTTIDMTVVFHRAVTEKTERVIITSEVVKAGMHIVSLKASVFDPEGKLIATCQSNLLNIDHVQLNY